jgi:peptidoglycan-associated lipoprotein
MFAKLFSIITVLFVVSACSGLPKPGGKADSAASTSVSSDYEIASRNLEPFTPIPGSKTGAKASDRVFFGFDSAVLSSNAQRTLDRQVKYLKNNPRVDVRVEGHCDERGTREYNLALGERRAVAVKNYLVNSGVSSRRIQTVSYGKERPAVLGSNAAAWAENRRSVTVVER